LVASFFSFLSINFGYYVLIKAFWLKLVYIFTLELLYFWIQIHQNFPYINDKKLNY